MPVIWFINKKVLSAEERNSIWASRGYTNPPYKENTPVVSFKTSQNTSFVRVYGGNVKQAGSWIMRASDIEGLTPQQIQSKFALEHTPTYITDVNIPSGINIYTGITKSNFNQPGGGIQFDLDWAQHTEWFTNARSLS